MTFAVSGFKRTVGCLDALGFSGDLGGCCVRGLVLCIWCRYLGDVWVNFDWMLVGCGLRFGDFRVE